MISDDCIYHPISELPRLHKNRRQALDTAGAKAIPEVPVVFRPLYPEIDTV